MPIVKKQDLSKNKGIENTRLNEIRAKLRDPTGNQLLLEKHNIINRRFKNLSHSPLDSLTSFPFQAMGESAYSLVSANNVFPQTSKNSLNKTFLASSTSFM